MLSKLCWLYFLISSILAIPASFVVDPGFGLSGAWMFGMLTFFISAPMTYYFWPWRKRK